MTRDEITEFKAQTARRRAAEAEHPTPDAAAHDRATAAGLAVVRDVDHERALLEDRARTAAATWLTVPPMGDPVTSLRLELAAARDEALVEYRRVLAGRRLERRCEICGPGADHTNRAHDDEFDARDRTPDLARIADDPDTPRYVADTAAMMLAFPEEAILFDHESALVIDREYRAAVVNPEVGARELDHPADPHPQRPTECRTCARPIHVRTDDQGVFVSAAHYA